MSTPSVARSVPAEAPRFAPWFAPWFALCLSALCLSGCGAPALPAATRAEAAGFERHPSAAPLWARWGRAGELRFLEVVVGTDEVELPLPLVIALHGFGDAPRVPERPYLGRARPYRLVLPEGPVRLEAGRAWSPLRVRDGRPAELATDLDARAAQLATLLEVLVRARPTRGGPVLVGFSQGGHLALALATKRPELVTLALPMAAWLPPPLEPSGPPPSRVSIRGVHAREDERVSFEPTFALYERLSAHGWDARLEVVEGQHAPGPAIDAFIARELDRALLARDP